MQSCTSGPRRIKTFAVDKTTFSHPGKAQFVNNGRSRGQFGVAAYFSKAVFLQYYGLRSPRRTAIIALTVG